MLNVNVRSNPVKAQDTNDLHTHNLGKPKTHLFEVFGVFIKCIKYMKEGFTLHWSRSFYF